MKNVFILAFIFILFTNISSNASTFEGGVSAEGQGYSSRIVDKNTGNGVENAIISLPKQNYSTTTDSNGFFELNTQIDGSTILSVQKKDYKPFSATITPQSLSHPIVIGIEKTNASDMVIDSNMYHLGDNRFSNTSANAGEFRVETIGPFYSKRFILKNLKFTQPIFLVIGSIIGIDTVTSRTMGQSGVMNAFASPPEVYFNGNKIAEIQINGDGQRIRIPNALIKRNQVNEVTIKTGHNLVQTAYVDYDDIEFMNLLIEN